MPSAGAFVPYLPNAKRGDCMEQILVNDAVPAPSRMQKANSK